MSNLARNSELHSGVCMASRINNTVKEMINSWRIVRLSKDAGLLGLPTVNILGKVVELGPEAVAGSRGTRTPESDDITEREQDAHIVQRAVERMSAEIRASFVAYHLATIRGTTCRKLPHKARANTLGIPRSTYYLRVENGEKFIALHLDTEGLQYQTVIADG